MLIDAPPTLLNTIIHKKHISRFMAKSMNELAHKSPLILFPLVTRSARALFLITRMNTSYTRLVSASGCFVF